MDVKLKLKRLIKIPLLSIVVSMTGLILLFQNCAAPAAHQSQALLNSEDSDMPMSKVVVHLSNDDGRILSDVELVADDVMNSIDRVPSAIEKTEQEKISTALPVDNQSSGAQTSYNLELPLGAEKIIVARAKVRDPVSNQIAAYYGNAIVNLNESIGEVTIKMVAMPSGD